MKTITKEILDLLSFRKLEQIAKANNVTAPRQKSSLIIELLRRPDIFVGLDLFLYVKSSKQADKTDVYSSNSIREEL